MIAKDFTISNRLGIHARPAALFAKAASRFQSDIRVIKDGLEINGKSIMGIMMLAAAQGNTITIRADGADEEAAIRTLENLLENRFGEE
ncbi:MAG: HPr family phosphocarrier protein [bacterium]